MAPQNVCQKFTFVKVLNVVCGKMARNGLKMANSQHCDLLRYPVFRYHFTAGSRIRWFLFAEILADASAERLSTVSSPFLSFIIIFIYAFNRGVINVETS